MDLSTLQSICDPDTYSLASAHLARKLGLDFRVRATAIPWVSMLEDMVCAHDHGNMLVMFQLDQARS